MPKVSVIIPSYNTSQYIGEGIDSVLRQTFKDFEIIVIDDGSTDNTKDAVRKYAEKIKYIYQDNAGVCVTLNFAIDLAQGEYIAICSDDDIWLPNNLEAKVQFLDKYKETLAVTSDFEIFGDSFSASSFAVRGIFQDKKNADFLIRDSFDLLAEQCFAFASTTVVRKLAFYKFGGFTTIFSEDYYLFLKIAQVSDIGCINRVLVKRRDHNNVSINYNTNYPSRIFALGKILVSPLTKKYYKNKIRLNISKSYFIWSCNLLADNRIGECRQKAMLSLQYALNINSLKVIIKSFILRFYKLWLNQIKSA